LHFVAVSAAMRRASVALNASLAAAIDLQFSKTKSNLIMSFDERSYVYIFFSQKR
jgi:hypothetical protein